MLKLAMNKKMIIASASAIAMIAISAVSVAAVTGMQRNAPDSMAETSSTDVINVTGTNVEITNEYNTATAQGASTVAVGTTTASTAVSEKETLNTTKATSAQTTNMNTTKRTEAMAMAGKKDYSLDISSKSDSGTLKFSKAIVDYDNGQVWLYFSINEQNKVEIVPSSITATINGKRAKLMSGELPTPAKQSDGTYKADNCYVSFQYTPNSSPVTLNYAFEGHDPQSVQITIPGV